jgi:hypothetical protein
VTTQTQVVQQTSVVLLTSAAQQTSVAIETTTPTTAEDFTSSQGIGSTITEAHSTTSGSSPKTTTQTQQQVTVTVSHASTNVDTSMVSGKSMLGLAFAAFYLLCGICWSL